jgi:hypothetical protein
MVRMKVSVDDELKRLVGDRLSQLFHGSEHLIRVLRQARIHHQNAVIADLHRNIAAGADEHGDVALDVENVDFVRLLRR